MQQERNFNSIKVRLKPAQNFALFFCKLFQFHKGTIKTQFTYQMMLLLIKFQFHKGTIKTYS